MGGVQLLLQPSHFRLELVHLRAEGVALGGLPTAFARGQALKRPLTPRPAPFRQMGAVQPLAAKQPAHLAGLRAALCLLQNPQSILRGELAPLRLGHDFRVRRWPRVAGSGPGGLVATLLDPQGRSAHLLQCHRFSLCGHWYSPPPPYSNSKGGRCLSDVGREGSVPSEVRLQVTSMLRLPVLRISRSRSMRIVWRRPWRFPKPAPHAVRFDVPEGLSVHPGRAAVAADPPPGFREKVLAPHLVDQRVETPAGFFLGFRM